MDKEKLDIKPPLELALSNMAGTLSSIASVALEFVLHYQEWDRKEISDHVNFQIWLLTTWFNLLREEQEFFNKITEMEDGEQNPEEAETISTTNGRSDEGEVVGNIASPGSEEKEHDV